MSAGRRMLKLVGEPAEVRPAKIFCGHCAREPEGGAPRLTDSRVCQGCGLGLLLEADPAMAPTPTDPFLVTDAGQHICAVSKAGESLLGVDEPQAVNRHLTDFIVPADLGHPAAYSLAAAVVAAATGAAEPIHIAVRPPAMFGVRHWARIGSCGPPSAALIVIAAVD
jgi:hypothetical protein